MMTDLKKLEDYRDEIEQCVKCGACRAHCPVFGAEKHEGRVARGKVALAGAVLDDEIDLQPKVLEDMSQCLLCGSCWAQCPNKVPTDEIVAAARRRIAEKGVVDFRPGDHDSSRSPENDERFGQDGWKTIVPAVQEATGKFRA